jgi:hypothetical protein
MPRKILHAAVWMLTAFVPLTASVLIPADDPNILYTGRWDFSDPKAPSHSWPGVSVTARFEGTSVGVKLTDNFTYFNVFIDGAPMGVFKGTSAQTASYTLAEGLTDGPHTLTLFKRNETTWTRFAFNGLILDDGKTLLSPPERPARRIEFIGDSFTSAEWNELTGAPDSDAPVTNVYEGFGPIVGRHYGAEVHMTSISGWGLVVEWQGDYTKNLPDQFGQAHAFGRNQAWDFEQWIPNLVVIGLGLNDYNAFGGYSGTIAEENRNLYISRYHEFIATIRDVYPGVRMLAVAANGLEWLKAAIGQVVDEENAEGYGDVFYADYPYYNGGYANYHPTVATHVLIADRLIAAIEGLDPWQPYDDTKPPAFTRLPASPFFAYAESIPLEAETDTYATVRWSDSDKPYTDMENTFNETGRRDHATVVSCGHGQTRVLFLRAADAAGNAMDTSAVVQFTVDTTKADRDWTQPGYDDSGWASGVAPVGNRPSGAFTTAAAGVRTVYFRKALDIPGSASVTRLTLMIRGGDGLVAYFNGIEAGRYNFPEDEEPFYGVLHACPDRCFERAFPHPRHGKRRGGRGSRGQRSGRGSLFRLPDPDRRRALPVRLGRGMAVLRRRRRPGKPGQGQTSLCGQPQAGCCQPGRIHPERGLSQSIQRVQPDTLPSGRPVGRTGRGDGPASSARCGRPGSRAARLALGRRQSGLGRVRRHGPRRRGCAVRQGRADPLTCDRNAGPSARRLPPPRIDESCRSDMPGIFNAGLVVGPICRASSQRGYRTAEVYVRDTFTGALALKE